MNADYIKSIPLETPGVLFKYQDSIKQAYKDLAKVWHPDKSTGDADVFAHITQLYNNALEMAKASHWDTGSTLALSTTKGTKYSMRYKYKQEFELGTYFVSDTVITYMIRQEYSSLVETAIQNMKPVFPDKKMEAELSRFLPSINIVVDTTDHRFIILNKTKEVVPLRWVVQHFDKVDPRQTAWMTSALLNLCCGMQVSGVVHNDISLDSVFVSLKYHSVCLFGGWWWSGRDGAPMTSVPKRTFQMLPTKVKNKKQNSVITSMTLSKATIREAMGSLSGPSLRTNKDIPVPFVDWLLSPCNSDAIATYIEWKSKVLPAMKYKREFVLWDVPQKELLT